MRLAILQRGQKRIPRAFIKAVGTLSPPGLDDVALTSLYRPWFFGRAWIALLRQVMRGPSDWSTGERELFAAFTAWLTGALTVSACILARHRSGSESRSTLTVSKTGVRVASITGCLPLTFGDATQIHAPEKPRFVCPHRMRHSDREGRPQRHSAYLADLVGLAVFSGRPGRSIATDFALAATPPESACAGRHPRGLHYRPPS